jgi:hypothetical protein
MMTTVIDTSGGFMGTGGGCDGAIAPPSKILDPLLIDTSSSTFEQMTTNREKTHFSNIIEF